jgi:hypothetical protein
MNSWAIFFWIPAIAGMTAKMHGFFTSFRMTFQLDASPLVPLKEWEKDIPIQKSFKIQNLKFKITRC